MCISNRLQVMQIVLVQDHIWESENLDHVLPQEQHSSDPGVYAAASWVFAAFHRLLTLSPP